ncbi:hypothetical protein L596_023587 [Steinernema carpocapsae]|uniref:Mitochondrial chaperone BCS1 n=1 Tax=Steinernema carpocapsae TaxID=34508 RepID=A0A4V5ZZL7_STECR|nr:hypothetical protein L596_023587 [Steinernema carpocapsae]
MIQTQVNNKDVVYPWILNYIMKKSGGQTRILTIHTDLDFTESGKAQIKQTCLPGIGTHYIVVGYRWIKVERQREEQHIQDTSGMRMPLETMTMTTLGTDPQFFVRMFAEATMEAINKRETGLVIYNAIGPQWVRFGEPRRKRTLDSVVLDRSVRERVEDDLNEFIKSAEWYYGQGIPYRRGYLFYGPPGTGKTSYIKALASSQGYSVCIVSMSDRTLDDDRLCHLLNTAPKNSVVILEDIDACGVNHRDPMNKHVAYDGMTRVTYSGLLNAIDGIASTDERILFMTTNHKELIDKALIRPGRIDCEQYFGNCSKWMVGRMFQRFYGDLVDEAKVEEFQNAAFNEENKLSPAAIQGHLVLNKKDPEKAIQSVKTLLEETKIRKEEEKKRLEELERSRD